MTRIIDCVIATTKSNGWPQEVSLMTLGWIKFSGGDYDQETTVEQMEKFRDIVTDTSDDFMKTLKESGALDDQEQKQIPLAIKSDTIEAFVIEMVAAMKLHPAIAMQFLGAITFAGGDLKTKIHIPTLSAHIGRVGAKHGYHVELSKAEDEPLNITGAMM